MLTASQSSEAIALPRRLLIISNGHGEDSIGAVLAARLPPAIEVHAYPTLGEGRAYHDVCPVVGPRASLPSEGWRNVRHSVLRDVAGGGLSTIPPSLRFLSEVRHSYDRVVVVGDMVGVYFCWASGYRAVTYVDVYKTGYGRSYLWLDRIALRRVAETVFCRHENLAATLRARRIDARCAGNIMLDTIPRRGLTLQRRHPVGITLLPGSRTHALRNFALQVAALRLLPEPERLDLYLALAGSLDREAMARAADLELSGESFQDGRLTIQIVPGAALGDALDAGDFVLAQAGTATVQAIGLARPAITFQNPDDRQSRFAAESRMFGDGRLVVPADAAQLASAVGHWRDHPEEVARRGAIGQQRVGRPGALEAIIATLLA